MPAMPTRRSIVPIIGAVTFALATATMAYAADTLDFWNGHSASGECGTATLLGSQKIDNPAVSGIQQAGTIQKYKRTCTYPTSASQTCWNTRASIFTGSTVKAGVTWIGQGGTTQYWLMDQGPADEWISSPLICEHQVAGTSWGAWSAVDGVNATLYT